MKGSNELHTPFWTFSIIILLAVFSLLGGVAEGMFMDGVIYASIARNMAEGYGSFWEPYYSGPFWDHPPLMMGIQSLFFRVFGDHLFVEKIYSFIVFILTAIIMVKTWVVVKSEDPHAYKGAWICLLLWVIMDRATWGFSYNLLDSTLALFCLLAVYFLLKGLNEKRWGFYLIGALFIIAATMTKGPVGLFPLAVPASHWIAFRKQTIQHYIIVTLLLVICVAGFYLIIIQFEKPRVYFDHYWQEQVVSSLSGDRERTNTSLKNFRIIRTLFYGELLFVLLVCSVVWLFVKAKKLKVTSVNAIKRFALFFLLTGFSASLPIVISIKQNAIYLIPCLPYFAIGIGLLIFPYVLALMKSFQLSKKGSRIVNFVLLMLEVCLAILIMHKWNTYGRDKVILYDIHTLKTEIPKESYVYLCPSDEFDMAAYLQRYLKSRFVPLTGAQYVIVSRSKCLNKELSDSLVKSGYKQIRIDVLDHTLFEKNNVTSVQVPLSPKDP